jgi:hypothetical protein
MTNYRLPDNCCANCRRSYNNSYGDNCCYTASGKVVDAGGYCDDFDKDTSVATVQPELKEVKAPPWEGYNDCTGCAYIFDAGGTMKCMLNNRDATKKCRRYSGVMVSVNEAPYVYAEDIEPELIGAIGTISEEELEQGTCATCAFSEYRGSTPWCRFQAQEIDSPDGRCNDWAQEGSIVIL